MTMEINPGTNRPVLLSLILLFFSLAAAAQPLAIRYNVVGISCPSATDGFITVYASGGTPPYTYSYNGGPYTSNNLFGGLGAVSNVSVSVRDAATPNPGVVFSPSNLTITAPSNPLTVRPDSIVCPGTSLPLYASGSSTGYSWTATPNDPSIANPTAQFTTATPTQSTLYTVSSTVSRTRNLIDNGDFEQGDVAFESQYTGYPFPPNPANPGFAQRAYSIVYNGRQFEPQFQLCTDHTTGSGRMMAVDGAVAPNITLWAQKVAVTPNTNYSVQYWLQSIDPNSPSQLEMQMNGSPITGNASTSTLTASSTPCIWQQATYTWNSGTNTVAEIKIIGRNLSSFGNDYAIDDISMTQNVTCTFNKSSSITIPSSNIPVTSFNYASPICISGNNPVPTTAAGFNTGGVFSSTAGLTIHASTGVINLSASTPGTYTITYSVAASTCQLAGSSTTQVVLSNTVIPVTAFSYPSAVCANAGNITPSTPTGFTTGGVFSSSAGLSLNPSTGLINTLASNPGTYTITYSVSAGLCRSASSSSMILAINALPQAPTAANPILYCRNEIASPLTATGSNLRWYTQAVGGIGAATAPTPSTNTIGTSTYYVSQSIAGCESARTSITVTVLAGPIANAGPDKTIISGDEVMLDGTGIANPVSISWSPNTTITGANTYTPRVRPTTTTTYVLSIRDNNNCAGIDNVIVNVLPYCIQVMDAFTPNGDGINDRWLVVNSGGICATQITVAVFNRYGSPVYKNDNYNNDWTGLYQGKPIPDGTYYYVVSYRLVTGAYLKVKGDVTILR